MRTNDVRDLQSKMLCKLMISFITAGHCHDSARSIADQYIFTDPDRYLSSAEWMNAISSRKNAADLFLRHSFSFTAALYISNVFLNSLLLFCSSYLFYQFMLRRDHHKVNSEKCIGPGCICANRSPL